MVRMIALPIHSQVPAQFTALCYTQLPTLKNKKLWKIDTIIPTQISQIIPTKQTLKTLKLAGCININDSGLESWYELIILEQKILVLSNNMNYHILNESYWFLRKLYPSNPWGHTRCLMMFTETYSVSKNICDRLNSELVRLCERYNQLFHSRVLNYS